MAKVRPRRLDRNRACRSSTTSHTATILRHPVLLQRSVEKIAEQREALDEETIHGGAGEILSM
ncbi:hypothetical protein Q5H91_10555, partial [Sphingomonas sp. KR1UV-12]